MIVKVYSHKLYGIPVLKTTALSMNAFVLIVAIANALSLDTNRLSIRKAGAPR